MIIALALTRCIPRPLNISDFLSPAPATAAWPSCWSFENWSWIVNMGGPREYSSSASVVSCLNFMVMNIWIVSEYCPPPEWGRGEYDGNKDSHLWDSEDLISAPQSAGMRRGLLTQGHMSHSPVYCLVDLCLILTAAVCCNNRVHLSIYILSSALYGCVTFTVTGLDCVLAGGRWEIGFYDGRHITRILWHSLLIIIKNIKSWLETTFRPFYHTWKIIFMAENREKCEGENGLRISQWH